MRSTLLASKKPNNQLIQERMLNLAGSEQVPDEFKSYDRHLEVLGINFLSYSSVPDYQTIILEILGIDSENYNAMDPGTQRILLAGQQNVTLNAQQIDQVILKMVQKLEEQWNKSRNDQGTGKLRK